MFAIGSRSSRSGAAVFAPPGPTTASNVSPSASATRPTRLPLIAGRIRLSRLRAKLASPSGDGFRDELLEERHELLALAQEPSLGDEPRAHALLDAFHEHAVFGADLAVEIEQVVDPRGV